MQTLLKTNELPYYDPSDNETQCCPRFNPEGWDNQLLRFELKPFVKASTIGVFHMPLNMGSVFSKTWNAIKAAHADEGSFLVLSHDESPWHAEHLFSVSQEVPGAEMVYLTGDFLTKVFEGPFSQAREWCAALETTARNAGRTLETPYFFYTTCPRCAKHYGKNYVVGVAKLAS